MDLAEAIWERYWPRLDSAFIVDFSKACLQHTDPSKGGADVTEGEQLEEKDKKLLELLNPTMPNNFALSSEEIRSLEAFLDDMVEAYNDYGAQYDLFTKCMRLFLFPSFPLFPLFPSSIRCRALRELRGVLHVMTLSLEIGDGM